MAGLLYQTDAYLRQFTAHIAAVDGNAVELDRTAFYPGGGGQLVDEGVLSAGGEAYRVVSVGRKEGRIWHMLDRTPPPVGAEVLGEIDWDRRYRMMRTHTALHILCGVIFREFGALVTGGQMYLDRARMDFELADLSVERVRRIEELANAEIRQGRPVHARILPRAEAFAIPDLIRTKVNLLPEGIAEVRVVEIEGLDMQADGGTHVANTTEVGGIRVLKTENKGKNFKRIEIALVG